MGNLPTKRGTQNNRPRTTNTESTSNQILDESIQRKIDPLAIFDISDYSKEEIVTFLEGPEFKRKYKQLMIQNHPDRGGSVLKSSIINFAYEKLLQAKETMLLFSSQREKDANELRNESVTHEQSQRSTKEIKSTIQDLMSSNPDEFQKRFNEAFEVTKMNDYMDDGVEVNERTRSTKRGAISIQRDPTLTGKNINEVFERKAKVNQALVVRDSLHPEGVSSLKQSVYEYGKTEENDFGRFTKGAADYRIAYAGERLIDPTKAVPQGKKLSGTVTMSESKKIRERQNIHPEMTQSERDAWATEEEKAERLEEERKAILVERDYEQKKRQNIFMERILTLKSNIN